MLRIRNRGAFTLVELLVVIGIIAVLVSILLPDQYLLSDGTATVRVYGTVTSDTPTLGDNITISGPLSPFDGVEELDPVASATVTVHSQGNSIPPVPDFTIPQIQLVSGNLPSDVDGPLMANSSFNELATVAAAGVNGKIAGGVNLGLATLNVAGIATISLFAQTYTGLNRI